MLTTKQTIEDIKANGYNIDFGVAFNNAFENYKKIALNAGVAMLLITILLCMVFGMLAVGMIGMALSTDTLAQFKVENMSLLWLAVYFAVAVIFAALVSPLNAGILKMAHAAYQGESFSVGTVFDYYRSAYFKEIVMATVIIGLVSNTFSLGFQWVGFPLIGMVISLSVALLTFMVIPLIIFGNLKALDAIEGSMIIVFKQFFILFALMIVSTLFMMLGLFGFCIGIFFTIPFMYSMQYCIYNEIIGAETPEIPADATLSE